jgi:hypothetical protein
MARGKRNNEGNDPLDHVDDDSDIVDYVPAGTLPPPQPSFTAPATEAERRTEDMWERLLGTDEVGTGYVNVSRVTGAGNSSEDFVQKFPADQYDFEDLLEHLREHYGPGAYRIRLYVKGNGGRFTLKGNRLATIAKPLPGSGVAAIRDTGRQGQELATVLATFESMQQRSQQQMEQLIERMERRQAPQGNPAVEFAQTMQAMMVAMTPIFGLMKGDSRPAQTDPIEMLTKVMALQKQLQPPTGATIEGESESILGVVKEGIKALPMILSARNNATRTALPPAAPQAAQRRPVAPTFAPITDAPKAPEGEVPVGAHPAPDEIDRNAGDLAHPLHDNLCDLLNAAKAWSEGQPNVEPEQVAQMIVEGLQDAQIPLFRAFLESPTLARDLVNIHPASLDHMEWLLAMKDETIAMLDLIDGDNQGYDAASANDAPEALPDDGQQRQEDQPPKTA